VNVRDAFRAQAESCATMGSPFTARLCTVLARRLQPGDPVSDRVLGWKGDPEGRADALPLRLAGALHGLVIEGRDPALAAVYPPRSAGIDDAGLFAAVQAAFRANASFLLDRLASPPQTNETMRSAALCPGFLTIADRTRLPLVTSELGASAGLNLVWDRFRYRFGDAEWGPEGSSVRIEADWSGPPPPMPDVHVRERAGCDQTPVDLGSDRDTLRLQSYVWADQPERMARLRAALDIAIAAGIEVIRSEALDWLEERLALRLQGAVHVVYHSLFWQYLDAETQARAVEMLEGAGSRCTPEAPLAWLRLEGDGTAPGAAILLTLWPGGRTALLGRADYHGRWVRWSGLA
jgi:hypothetical protein